METNTLTDLIIKAAYQVHSELGTGYIEKVFENAMMIALRDLGLESKQQHALKVHFRGQIVGEYYADIIIMDRVLLELKAVKSLQPEHQAQLLNYLKATNMKTGLLINFARKGLEIKRMYNTPN